MRAIVVIPVYEPEECLSELANELEDKGYEILIVNDGSSSGHENVFEMLTGQATVLHHRQNRGKGAALKTAFKYIEAHAEHYNVVGVMDGDGQHLTDDMERLLEAAEKKRGSLILGVRSLGRKMPFRSRFGNRLTRKLFYIISGAYISDTQSGLRAFSVDLLPELLEIPGERYEYETNQLLCCVKRGIPVEEIPIRTVYRDRENSTSHFRAVGDSFRIYGQFIKFFGSSLVSFALDYLLSAFRYLALALGIFICNNLILSFYAGVLGLPAMTAKLLTEISLFLISFFVQKHLIFGKHRTKKPENMEVIL